MEDECRRYASSVHGAGHPVVSAGPSRSGWRRSACAMGILRRVHRSRVGKPRGLHRCHGRTRRRKRTDRGEDRDRTGGYMRVYDQHGRCTFCGRSVRGLVGRADSRNSPALPSSGRVIVDLDFSGRYCHLSISIQNVGAGCAAQTRVIARRSPFSRCPDRPSAIGSH